MSLEHKIPQADEEQVMCDWKECKDRGEYARCYFDIHVNCPIYLEHKSFLKVRADYIKYKKRKV